MEESLYRTLSLVSGAAIALSVLAHLIALSSSGAAFVFGRIGRPERRWRCMRLARLIAAISLVVLAIGLCVGVYMSYEISSSRVGVYEVFMLVVIGTCMSASRGFVKTTQITRGFAMDVTRVSSFDRCHAFYICSLAGILLGRGITAGSLAATITQVVVFSLFVTAGVMALRDYVAGWNSATR